MNLLLPLLALSSFLLACTAKSQTDPGEADPNQASYELVELDAYSFRRAYHDQEGLKEAELEAFMNRNPEAMYLFTNENQHAALFALLTEHKILVDGDLNLQLVDSLPEPTTYQFSKSKELQLETRLLEDPKQVKTPSYELTFRDNEKIVLIDTLPFDWPPDVQFFTMDLNKDGKEELFTVFHWYIINGDNYDVHIYELRE
ncbi:MAG: hypothetical protein A3D92_16160 [Bacteroidetes bacterium RIFCSPHIGHO2_02_FULL_44_7]|nr:MAG: hypothetical protein A3D92_16160 [Bacteroidetes bacterium RIFCSPHIGHO2_02_FULL_44_7]